MTTKLRIEAGYQMAEGMKYFFVRAGTIIISFTVSMLTVAQNLANLGTNWLQAFNFPSSFATDGLLPLLISMGLDETIEAEEEEWRRRGMGGCVGSSRDHNSPSRTQATDVSPGTVGHNKPLKPRKPKWKSDIRLTEAQLQAKRDEFWDTAPAFDGRKEIWDALKASAHALESGDHQLAQAILNGANISLPNGTLMDCYDELGNRYQLPVYVLSLPINIVKEESVVEATGVEERQTTSPGVEVPIKVHLSTGKDFKLSVLSSDMILSIKQQIQAIEGIDSSRQRIFFSGKLLGDRVRVEDAKIEKGYVLQVVVAAAAAGADVKSSDLRD